MKPIRQTTVLLYLVLSFLEGGAVMAVELLGAKMIAPFFGSSLYVWASVLGITLGGLASGYYAGGVISQKRDTRKNLMWVLLFASGLIVLMPLSAKIIMPALQNAELTYAIVVSCIVFLLPPLFFLGTVSPLIIKLLSENFKNSGKAAGQVYAISTVGGILATFLTGFFIIPQFGLTIPAVVSGVALGIIPLVILIKGKNFTAFLFIGIVALVLASWINKKNQGSVKVLYESEGILGQVMVVDYPQEKFGKDAYTRVLLINKMAQTVYNSWMEGNPYSPYILGMAVASSVKPEGSSALLLGLGGGALAKNFSELGFLVDAVEIDRRIIEATKKYFVLPGNVNVIQDDARRMLNRLNKKYDIIAIDIYIGEEQPSHILSIEALGQIHRLLKNDGMLLVNFNGYLTGTKGKGTRSVIKTISTSGLIVKVLPTPGGEDERNTIIAGFKKKLPLANIRLGNLAADTFFQTGISLDRINTNDAVILTDDKPALEFLNREAVMNWRKNNILTTVKELSGSGVEIFK